MYLTTYATIFFAPPQVISSAAQESENMGRALRKYVRLGVVKDCAPDILCKSYVQPCSYLVENVSQGLMPPIFL